MQPVHQLAALRRVQDQPGFGLSELPALMDRGVFVVRVHLHAQLVPGVNQLQQQREGPVRVFAHQLLPEFHDQVRQLPAQRVRAFQPGNAAGLQAFPGDPAARLLPEARPQPVPAPGRLLPAAERGPQADRPERGLPLQRLVEGDVVPFVSVPVQPAAAAETQSSPSAKALFVVLTI